MDELKNIVEGFVKDLIIPFPECVDLLNNDVISGTNFLSYFQEVYPKYFFDILSQNVELFETVELFLLPGIDFSVIWKQDISDQTRESIWKYLKLILFATVHTLEDHSMFGDSAKLFEAMSDSDLKEKVVDTFSNMADWFELNKESNANETDDNANETDDNANETDDNANETDDNANDKESNHSHLDPEKIHNHMNKLLEGKLGSLAKEIAAEAATELDIDLNDSNGNTEVLYEKLFKNKETLGNLMKTVGTKIDSKLKNGEIDKDELIKEATDLMANMKNMPGMADIFNKMSKQKGGGGINMNTLDKVLKKNEASSKTRQRMLQKMLNNKTKQAETETKPIATEQEQQAAIDSLLMMEQAPRKTRHKKK
jgi:hypothetical protein